MEWAVWVGAAVTVTGFLGILYSAFLVSRARKAASDDTDLRARMQRILPLNLGALFLSFLGLLLVVFGVILA